MNDKVKVEQQQQEEDQVQVQELQAGADVLDDENDYDDPRVYGFDLPHSTTQDSGYDRRFVLRFDPRWWDLGFFVAKFQKIAD